MRRSTRSIDLRLHPLAACLALAIAGASSPVVSASGHGSLATDTTPVYQLRQQLRQARNNESRNLQHAAGVGHRDVLGTGNTLPVTSCADDDGPGTLRSVVATAQEGDTVDLSALTCSTITLIGGPIDTSVLGDHNVYDLTIQGPGEDALTIDGANNGEIFVSGGFYSDRGTLDIRDLTIANGTYTHGLAGCIEALGGTVALTNTTVTSCAASNGGPLTFGGAIDTYNLTMNSSRITGSTSEAAGDNVAIGAGAYATNNADLVDSVVSGNTITAETGQYGTYLSAGGGIYARGDLTLTDSTISGNTVNAGTQGLGGGVFTRGYASITGSSFFDNQSEGSGGGLYKAIFSNYGDSFTTLTIMNSTFSGNSAAVDGGGLVSTRPTQLDNSTIAFNSAQGVGGGVAFVDGGTGGSTLDLQSAILANNEAADGPDIGASTSVDLNGANNLVMAAGNGITLPADTLSADPMLAPLADNGGPTLTHDLDPASPAIDAGNNSAKLEFDQRGDGYLRVAGPAADIGALEVQGPDDDIIFQNGFD